MEQSTQEELARVTKIAAEALQPFARNLRLLQKQLLSPIFQNAIHAQIATLSHWVEPMLRLQQPLLRLMEFEVKKGRVAKAFQECDLCLAPSMMELTDEVVRLYYDGKKQIIPSFIARYYKRNNWAILKKTVSNWESNSFFQPRMRIIYDALKAHIDGKYTLSVPALLPHIEGIARDIAKKYNLPKSAKTIVYRKRKYGKDGAKTLPSTVFGEVAMSALSFEEWVSVESLLYYLEGTLYLSLGNFREELERLKKESKLNRHLVLHGIQTKYATQMNSLRCFLLLDALSMINTKEDKQD